MWGYWWAATSWKGWLVSLGSEGLWLAYAFIVRSVPLVVMSFLWAAIHGRNTIVTYRNEHP
jgi:hypothetical protein